MKRLSTWFALILILSVSLLSAAGSGSDEKHQNQPNSDQSRRRNEPHQPAPAVTIIVQPAPVTVVQPSAPIEKNQPAEKWYQRPTITDWGILGVTVLYTLVSLGLLYATNRQANLAERSARISQEMLDKDRPMIIVTDYELMGYGPNPTTLPPAEQNKIENYVPVAARFKITNVGPAIAILESGVSSVDLFPCVKEFPKGEFPPMGDYSRCRAMFLQKTTLKTDEFEPQGTPMENAFFTPEQFKDLQMLKAVVVLYGIVRYNGVVKRAKSYASPFFFVYQPAGGFIHKGLFYHGPDHRERNRAT